MPTALDAVYQVLTEAGESLHVKEITRRVLERGLWQTTNPTPQLGIAAALQGDLSRRGDASRFRRTGKATYGLNATSAAIGATGTIARPARTEKERTVGAVAPAVGDGAPFGAPATAGPLSFTDAAEAVLRHFAGRRPMHYRAITAKAQELGLISTTSQTPAMAMDAVLHMEIDRVSRRGEQPRFSKQGRGLFGLSEWLGKGLARDIEEHNRAVRRQLREQLYAMDPTEFEQLMGRLLTALGFESVAVTRATGDGGIDVRGTLVVGEVVRLKMAVQVKRFRQNVQTPVVQQVRGSLGAHEQGLIITTSDFSLGARAEAERRDATPVALMNGEQLVNLLIDNGILVRRTSHILIELGEDEDKG